MINYELIIFLLFSHFIGDVFLRSRFIDYHKSRSILVFIFHCFMWSGCISLVLKYYAIFTISKFLFLFVGHMVIDYFKMIADPNTWEVDGAVDISIYKIIDQFLHLLQLGVVCIL